MKKTFVFLLLLASFSSFSQAVTIDPTYTPDQLINSVLINSPCVAGTNITVSTGSNFGSTNGIGYFENFNPNFPFERGIVLTTGDVTKVPSPNTTILSDGTTAWGGDADLEAVLLSQSGITFNSINASYIAFDFVPSSASVSFDFIFASEEYGTSQCNFSDAFAFLVKNMTTNGPNTNIAVIPGTDIPISVATIRDNLYNDNCPSVNPSYFGSFNGSGFGPAINFNGQTKKMTATAIGLIVGNTYRIKIVIADGQGNVGYDSAIFLNANSFNINPDVLGADAAFCIGATLPILQPTPALLPGTTYVWKRNNVVLAGQTSSTLNLNTVTPAPAVGDNIYSLTYTEPGCSALTDEVTIKIHPPINALAVVPNLLVCNTSAPTYAFDLSKNTTRIMTGQPANIQVSYYASNAEAIDGTTGQLPISYTIPVADSGKTIYTRITNPVTNCYEIRTFQLIVIPQPVITAMPASMTLCARALGDLRATFNFTTALADVLGAQNPDYVRITFHTSQANATNNAGLINLNNANTSLQQNRNVWIRVSNPSDPTCFTISSTFFQLIITPLPQVDIYPDIVVCTSYELPAMTYPTATYHTANNGGGTVRPVGYVVTTTSTIYVHNAAGDCKANDSFRITIANLPAIAPASGSHCIQYSLPSLPYGKYFKLSGGPLVAGQEEYPAGHVINTAGLNQIFVWFEDTITIPNCTRETDFTIDIIPFEPLVASNPAFENKFTCNPGEYLIPAPPAGVTFYSGTNKQFPILTAGTPVMATQTIYAYKESGTTPTNCTSEVPFTVFVGIANISPPTDVNSCTAYALPPLTVGEYRTAAGGGGSLIPVGTVFSAPSTQIFFYVPGQSCTNNLSFNVNVSLTPLPPMPDVGPVCDVYYLPAVAHAGDYFTGPGGTGVKRSVGYPITSTQTIYFYDKAPTGPCFVEEDILITVHPSPPIDARPLEVIKCNEIYHLDPLTNGHYYALPGGPTVADQVLLDNTNITEDKTIWVYSGSTNPLNTCFQEYSIDVFIVNTVVNEVPDVFACDTYNLPAIVGPGDYYTQPGGPHGTGVLVPVGSPVTTTSTFYIYAENTSRVACSDEKDVIVTIYNTPVVAPIASVTECDSYNLPALVAPATRYFTLPGGPAGGGVEKFAGDPITTTQTVYAYAESGTLATQICFDEEPLSITINNTPVIAAYAPVFACDTYLLPAYTAPVTNYFTANDGTGTEMFPSDPITVSTTIYGYAETGTLPNCSKFEPINITIYTTPTVAPIASVTECDLYNLPALIAPATRYFTLPGGPAGGGVEKFAGDPITTTQTVYAYAESGTLATQICFDEEPLSITINNTPVIAAYAPVFACDTYLLPAYTAPVTNYFTANDGTGTEMFPGDPITVSTTIYGYAETGTTPNCSKFEPINITITTTPVFVPSEVADVNVCDSYTLPALSTPGSNYYTGPNGTGTIIPATTVFTTNQLIYAYAVNGTSPNECVANEDIVINIFNVEEPTDVINCGPYTLPALLSGAQYYSSPNGVSPISVVTASQIVYVFATAPFSGCTDQSQFNVTINANAVANPVPASLTTVCDNDANPDDQVTPFDLDSLTATVLGTQNPAFYTVAYYPSLGDAVMSSNQIVTDGGTNTDTSLSEVYVKVSNGTSASCEDIMRITITVIPKPHIDNGLSGIICTDSETGTVTRPVIVSGYSSSFYTFEWTDSAGNVVSNAPNFVPSATGTYSLVVKAIGVSNCESNPITVTVTESAKPASVTYETSNWFTDNQTITVTAVPYLGDGSNFRYSLDGQTPQVSNIFTNVKSGPHEIVVIDINGCGETPVPIPVQLVNSPKFFSPNGDGINDYWKISGLENQPNAKLYIFDRYGKLLTQVFVNSGSGWDGTINGQPLPGNDYWFTVTYEEGGVPKEFKSHFALIR